MPHSPGLAAGHSSFATVCPSSPTAVKHYSPTIILSDQLPSTWLSRRTTKVPSNFSLGFGAEPYAVVCLEYDVANLQRLAMAIPMQTCAASNVGDMDSVEIGLSLIHI